MIVTLVVATLGGYAFARFRFPGKDALFLLVLSILMVPYATLLIPLVIWLKDLGLSNTLVGVGLVLAVFQLPFAMFMMRISFEAVPKELEEAALVDGCGSFGACAACCCRPSSRASSPSGCSRSSPRGTTSWCPCTSWAATTSRCPSRW